MQELRLVAVSEDGSYAVLAIPGRGGRFTLPVDDKLRAVARGQFSRLAQYDIEVESPLRPKEIQARIRAGETAEEIADAAGVPIERVRWFEGPVLAERAYVAQQAQAASVRRPGDSAPGPRLGEIVAERLSALGMEPEDAQWDSRKRGDGSWQVQVTFTAAGRPRMAEWVFDPRRRHALPADDDASRLSLPEADLAPQQDGPGDVPERAAAGMALGYGQAPLGSGQALGPGQALRPGRAPRGEATVTSIAPRLGPAPASVPAVTRPRQEPEPEPARAPDVVAEPASAGPEPARQQQERPVPPAEGIPDGGEDTDGAEVPPRERPARRAAGGKGKRASVPSWDEIMFGTSRQQD